MTLHARWCALLLLLLLPLRVWADSPITINPAEAFVGMAPRGAVYPVAVELRNSGPSVEGALIVQSEAYSAVLRSYAYPVSLPTGTDKIITVYPVVGADTNAVDFSFDGGRAEKVSLSLENREGQQIGMIGDEAGALAALRTQTVPPPTSSPSYGHRYSSHPYNDCYARPEDAPDRAAGYQSLSVIVLAAGAERLRPEQWDAIRRWVLDGGSLIMLGGPGASYLNDPGAQAVAPEIGLSGTAVSGLTPSRDLPVAGLPAGQIGVQSGQPVLGAQIVSSQGSEIVAARRSLGAGSVLLIGFDPLEEPFRDWTGFHDLILSLLLQGAPSISNYSLHQWTQQQASFQENSEPYEPGVEYTGQSGVDPFKISLPPISTIAWMLFAYFLLVVPVSYLILRKLGRLELAWVTSPLISVAFAYGFYLFTAQLYQAGLSRRTAGVLVAAAGNPEAQFDGFSEMFIPHGGSYGITVPGAEAMELSPLSANDEETSYYPEASQNNLQTLDTIDVGEVAAPSFNVGNLAFSRVYHTEPLSLGGAITAKLTRTADGGISGTISNGTSVSLLDSCIYQPGSTVCYPIGEIDSNSTARTNRTQLAQSNSLLAASPFAGHITMRFDTGALLIARCSGAGLGPASLGKDVGGGQSVIAIISVPVSGKSRS